MPCVWLRRREWTKTPKNRARHAAPMNRARLQRKTVGDPQALPGSRVYLETSGRVWHDLRFVHVSLANHGLTRQWKWYRGDLRRAWQQAELEEGLHFHLNVAPATRMSNICTSFALAMALWFHVRSIRAFRAHGRSNQFCQTASLHLRRRPLQPRRA